MPHSRLSARVDSPTVDVLVDLGHPFLNYTLDGFIKIGGVGAAHGTLQEAFSMLKNGSSSLGVLCQVMDMLEGVSSNVDELRWINSSLWAMFAERVTKRDLEKVVKESGRQAFQWGMVAGLYTGMEYGMERVRGKHDWKNAALGGALTGALLSLGDTTFNRDKMIRTAITGGAIATASEFIRYLT